jgi:LmbE family N-acetylglucosaminyl deacetylase
VNPPALATLDRCACVDRARVRRVAARPPVRGPLTHVYEREGELASQWAALLAELQEGLEHEIDAQALHLPDRSDERTQARSTAPRCDVLALLPHPDDESIYAGGTIARLTSRGYRVHVVTLTGGEGGRAAIQASDLAALRASEWLEALTVLGVAEHERLGFADFGKYRDEHKREPVTAEDTLRRWGLMRATLASASAIRCHRPRVILTMAPDRDPNFSLHGHHLASGLVAMLAFHLAAMPTRAAGQDDLANMVPWAARAHWVLTPPHAGDARTFNIAVDPELKLAAVRKHRSQRYSSARLIAALERREPWTLLETLELLQARGPRAPAQVRERPARWPELLTRAVGSTDPILACVAPADRHMHVSEDANA